MATGFIIMQIGNAELDDMCEQVIVPALEESGIDAKRVDKHNEGGLLKSEIISFIEEADIIVADLTNERQNCYLEIGYSMGIDKFRNLILTAREDHNPESPNYVNGGPKIHFDLIGYDILFWHPEKLEEFKEELEKRIRRRRAVLVPKSQQIVSPWDREWIKSHSDIAIPKLLTTGKSAFFEVCFSLNPPKPWKNQHELREAAKSATIPTFGWPIGVFMENRDEFRPKPKADGIVAEILGNGSTYDYWTIRRNGDYYLLKTIFEDERDATKIFFDTRIVRTTEVLLYCARLYNRLDVDQNAVVNIEIRHGGLNGRVLGSANKMRPMWGDDTSVENEIVSEISTSITGLENDLVSHVRDLVTPLFTLFNFFTLEDHILEDIVNAYVEGRVI